jgi:hypothetical protein
MPGVALLLGGEQVAVNPLSVVCHYCGAQPGEPCRQTMLDCYTPVEAHKMRQAGAAESQGGCL